MDENYLDNLLNEFSLDKEIDNNIEEELDEQIRKEKDDHIYEQTVSREDSFNMDLEQDAGSGSLDSDIDFSEDQIEELDHLDNLADMDIGDLDFSDLDFDDLDITKLSEDVIGTDFDDLLKDFDGDLEIPSFDVFGETSSQSGGDDLDSLFEDGTDNNMEPESSNDDNVSDTDISDNTDINLEEDEGVNNDQPEDVLTEADENNISNDVADDLNEDNFDADSFLDSLLEDDSAVEDAAEDNNSGQSDDEKSDDEKSDDEESSDENSESQDEDIASLDDMLNDDDTGSESGESAIDTGDSDLLSEDDLFSMLDLDEESNSESGGESVQGVDNPSGEDAGGELDTSALEGLEDIEDISEKPKKKKRSFMEILFGPPDEDDEPTEEELKAIEEKKAAKKAKKEAAAEAKKAKAEKDKADKSKKDADKKRADAEKAKVKAEKKAKKKAIKDAEAKNAEPEKKLNKPAVIFIFSVFLGGVAFFYLSTVDFNYRLAIEHAANYFASQKYHKAYDEIKGVDVKEKDKELKERIYTVMYVERLYEGYENNIELGRQKKALDSLLRGVDKYYEYYDEAKELDIVDDIDYSFARIQNALQQNYGITVERALEINDMDDYQYMKTIEEYTGGDEEE